MAMMIVAVAPITAEIAASEEAATNYEVSAAAYKLNVQSLWASRHDGGRVLFKWTAKPGAKVTGWKLKYRTRKIGGNHKWSGWTTKSYGTGTKQAWISVKTDRVIEVHAQAKGDSAWSSGIITCPAGGRYQAMKSTHVLNMSKGKRFAETNPDRTGKKQVMHTSIALEYGQSIKVKPDYDYPVSDYVKRPRLYPTHMLYDIGNKSLITITKPDGKKYDGGIIDGVATIKGVKPGATTIVFRSPNGRTMIADVTVAQRRTEAPHLIDLIYAQDTKSGKYYTKLRWKSDKGHYYQVLRKSAGENDYTPVKLVKATSSETSYRDENIGQDASYVYTVRQVTIDGKKITKGSYDVDGLLTLAGTAVEAHYTNRYAELSWNEVENAEAYRVYRKAGKSDNWHLITTIPGTEYKDVYHDASDQTSVRRLLTGGGYCITPSLNSLIYMVRPVYSRDVAGYTKASYGLFSPDGEYRLEAPTIVSLSDDGMLKWGLVPNAEGYEILRMDPGDAGEAPETDAENWTVVADVKADAANDPLQELQISMGPEGSKYAVRAYASKDGERFYSDFDPGFSTINRKYDENILYMGDSITYGTPFFTNSARYFAYPKRISQLTGTTYFNASVGGATYTYNKTSGKYHIVNGVAQMVLEGNDTAGAYVTSYRIGGNTSTMDEYDVVVLSAGLNDYYRSFELGSRESDWEKIDDATKGLTFSVNTGSGHDREYTRDYDYNIYTFDGAYNQTMKYIEEASLRRIQQGKAPIRVVTIGLSYSEIFSDYSIRRSCNTTENRLGLTLLDYQAELDSLDAAWDDSPVLTVYHYDTQETFELNHDNHPYLTSDNIHLSKHGYALLGNSIADFMGSNVLSRYTNIDKYDEEVLKLTLKHKMLHEQLEYLPDDGIPAYFEVLVQHDFFMSMLDELYEIAMGVSGEGPASEEAIAKLKGYIDLAYENTLITEEQVSELYARYSIDAEEEEVGEGTAEEETAETSVEEEAAETSVEEEAAEDDAFVPSEVIVPDDGLISEHGSDINDTEEHATQVTTDEAESNESSGE